MNQQKTDCCGCGAVGIAPTFKLDPQRRDGRGVLDFCAEACARHVYDVDAMTAKLWRAISVAAVPPERTLG